MTAGIGNAHRSDLYWPVYVAICSGAAAASGVEQVGRSAGSMHQSIELGYSVVSYGARGNSDREFSPALDCGLRVSIENLSYHLAHRSNGLLVPARTTLAGGGGRYRFAVDDAQALVRV